MSNRLLTLVASALIASTAVAQKGTAVYELTHTSTWSKATHPTNFPSFPHYSGLIGATHNSSVTFWQPGGLSSPGMESMAETGSTSTLRNEINAAITKGAAKRIVSGGGLTSPGSRKIRFTVDASHSQLTLVSMLAPSPDWFHGTHGLDLMKNGQWIDSMTVQQHLYDAGTDSGVSYTSANKDTQPRDKIALITTTSGPFKGASTLIGSYTIKRVAETLVYGCGVNAAGSMTTTGAPTLGNSVTVSAHSPKSTTARGSATILLLGAKAAPNFPCGIKVPSLGEVLVDRIFAVVVGAPWNGSPVPFTFKIPTQTSVEGARIFTQGLFVQKDARLELTDATTILVGR